MRAVSLTAAAIWCASLVIARSQSVPASSPTTLDQAAEVSAARIARLAEQFVPLRSSAARRQSIDALAERIHREVDDFVAQAITPAALDNRSIESALRRVLSSAAREAPIVFVAEGRAQRLAIAYVLAKAGAMGPGGTSVTLRVYVDRGGRLALSDTTGSDLDGYASISIVELRPRAAGDAWFLLAGRLTGANGPNTRMRIYAHDGRRFRTIWMPENVWGDFAVAVNEDGFTVTGTYYRGGPREERYAIAEDGVYRLPRR